MKQIAFIKDGGCEYVRQFNKRNCTKCKFKFKCLTDLKFVAKINGPVKFKTWYTRTFDSEWRCYFKTNLDPKQHFVNCNVEVVE